ncbi:MAG TPA: ABC transporter ATP-binding protein [Gaiellaceae bacterium]
MSLLEVEGLRIRLPTTRGLVTVVDGVDYAVEEGEVFGVAGESGSGKTMSMLSLLGLLPEGAVVEGRVRFGGNDLLRMPRRRMREIAGRDLAMVFQDPLTSLHPMLSVGRQLTEHVQRHLRVGKRDAERQAMSALEEVRIPDPASALRAFPHQFSGGMRQRIAIAIALACRPKLLIADEPTTALDVTVQAGILRLLDRLRRENDLSVILITHDLGVMSAIADRVAIFYAGRVVEAGSREDVLRTPGHPYTRALLDALPHPEAGEDKPLVAIGGAPPTPGSFPSGCAFHPRCSYAVETCRTEVPPLVTKGARLLACPPDPFAAR